MKQDRPPPANWQDFEDLCLKLWRPRLIDAKKNGRSGQPQAGVDIFGRDPKTGAWIGIQCKQRGQWPKKVLTVAEIETEVDRAEGFQPTISHFIVATTAPRDVKAQEYVRELSDKRRAGGKFSVDLFAWDDLQDWQDEGLTLRPVPSFTDEASRELAEALEEAQLRHEELTIAGDDAYPALEEILAIKRRLREGGQLKPGDFLAEGRFRLLELLGRGGFATVFKAYDREEHKLVAVKVLHGQYVQDRGRRERFFRGARKMAQLQHQGIVRVIEPHIEETGYHFFVMELVDGGDLQQAVVQGRVRGVKGLAVLREVAEALTFAHRLRVVHRDVKPANILLTSGDDAKLSDFDLVRAFDTTGGTGTGSILGTFLYIAPESMENAKEVGPAADTFSLAMTAAFILHGAELPSAVLRDPLGFFESLDISENIRRVLTIAASWQPERRYSAVSDFWAELEIGLSATDRKSRPRIELTSSTRYQESRVRKGDSVGKKRQKKVQEYSSEKDDSVLVEVPEGRYWVGGGFVNMSSFLIGKYPVTNNQYDRFLSNNPGHPRPSLSGYERFSASRQPVVGVSWLDARAYCHWAGLKLPTETQWEAAACGPENRKYPWGDADPTQLRANYIKSGHGGPTDVGELKAGKGPFGAFDQAGNVWEWCWDVYKGEIQETANVGDENAEAELRVARGGSYIAPAELLQVSARYYFPALLRVMFLGFRVAAKV